MHTLTHTYTSLGAAFGAWMMAVCVYYALPPIWSWRLCFVLGAILAATGCMYGLLFRVVIVLKNVFSIMSFFGAS